MKSFLDHILLEITPDRLPELHNECFVFPTRRACRHFENRLAKVFNNYSFWSPTVVSIQEFIQILNPEWVVASEIQLLTTLFEVYKGLDANTTFDEFYNWGKTLLKDFDEVDRNLVDTSMLYKNLQDIKDLEQVFGPDEEALQALIEFQKVMDISGSGNLFKQFSTTWATVSKAYSLVKQELSQKHLAYEGMLYQVSAQKLLKSTEVTFSKVTFSGFNALSKAEEVIFEQLLEAGKAHVYFDADRFYFPQLADEKNGQDWEPSRFLKKYYTKWKGLPVTWVDANGFEKPKNIEVIGVPLKLMQAKVAALQLEGTTNYNPENTAVVLADESVLPPILHAVPAYEVPINVTMGMPVCMLTIGEFISHYLEYQASILKDEKQGGILAVDTLRELLSSKLVVQNKGAILQWLHKTKQTHISWRWLKNLKDISNRELLLCEPQTEGIQLLTKLLELVKTVFDEGAITDQTATAIYGSLLELRTQLKLVGNTFDIKFIKKIITEHIGQLKLPMGKETDKGLQIMGFLETRILDFQNLIIVSANEGYLPAASIQKSFIPFGLRKAFGLPLPTEQDRIFSYHFYRLLQRASNISLVYNTQTTVDGSGEKSRYILQLEQRLSSAYKNLILTSKTISIPIGNALPSPREISIPKTTEIMGVLETLLFNSDRAVSPSLLIDYIECPLRFYLKRIKRMVPVEPPTSDIDAREFGNMVHQTMQEVYEPYVSKTLTKDKIDWISKHALAQCIEDAFESLLGVKTFTGKVEFERDKIRTALERLLKLDAHQAPIKIKGLELVLGESSFKHNLAVNGKPVILGGTIDRLDEITSKNTVITRILDYKTGKVTMNKYNAKLENALDSYIETYFSNPSYKAEFQLYYYALIFHRNFQNQPVTAGIIKLKSLGNGVHYVLGEPKPINEQFFNMFENRLQKLLEEIMNIDLPFSQTAEENTCGYCEFNDICGR